VSKAGVGGRGDSDGLGDSLIADLGNDDGWNFVMILLRLKARSGAEESVVPWGLLFA